jgi:hypothetical protein
LQPWTPSSAINLGDAWNAVRVIASGNNVYFFINGVLVWSGADSGLSSGQVGIGLSRSGSSTDDQLLVDQASLSSCGVPLPALSLDASQLNPVHPSLPGVQPPQPAGGGDIHAAPSRAAPADQVNRGATKPWDKPDWQAGLGLGSGSDYSNIAQAVTGVCTALVSNDDIRGALEIASQPFADTRDTQAATSAPDDPILPCVSGQRYHSVWYVYVPGSDGTLTADTFGSDYDTVLAVWSGQPGTLQNIACNDNSDAGLQSRVQVGVTAGTSYYVEVAGLSTTAAGALHLTIDGPAPSVKPGRQRVFVPIVIRGR